MIPLESRTAPLTNSHDTSMGSPGTLKDSKNHQEPQVQVVVAGSVAIDLSCNFVPPGVQPELLQPRLNTSNPGEIHQSLGGVGRNVATALKYMDVSARLCSRVGDDIAGSAAIAMLRRQGLETCSIVRSKSESRTAQYVAVNDAQKNLVTAMADMDILQSDIITSHKYAKNDLLPQLSGYNPKWLVVDANWNPATLHAWLREGRASGAKLALEPVSVEKSKRLFMTGSDDGDSHNTSVFPKQCLDLATPNALEIASMYEAARNAKLLEREDWFQIIDSMGLSSTGSRDRLEHLTSTSLVDQGVPQQSIQLLPFIPCIITTLGDRGVLLTQLLRPKDDRLTSPTTAPYLLSRSLNGSGIIGGVYMRLFPAVEEVRSQDIISVNGVGDTFLGVLIAGLTKSPQSNVEDFIDVAQRGSVMTLKSKEAVSPEISSLKAALSIGQNLKS